MHFFICEMRKKLGRVEYIRVGIGLYMAAGSAATRDTRDDQGRPGQQQDSRTTGQQDNTPTHTNTAAGQQQDSSRTARQPATGTNTTAPTPRQPTYISQQP
jgi:hypothetical protein